MARTPEGDLKTIIFEKSPNISPIFDGEPSVFGYEKLICQNTWLIIFFFELIFLIIAAVIAISGLNILLYQLIKSRAETMNSKVMKMQIMLVKTLAAQQVHFTLFLAPFLDSCGIFIDRPFGFNRFISYDRFK